MALQATPLLHHQTANGSLIENEVNDLNPAGCLLAFLWKQRLLGTLTVEVSDRKSEVEMELLEVELELELQLAG